MSKTTNDGLTRSGTGCFIAVPDAAVGVKVLRTKNLLQQAAAPLMVSSRLDTKSSHFGHHRTVPNCPNIVGELETVNWRHVPWLIQSLNADDGTLSPTYLILPVS